MMETPAIRVLLVEDHDLVVYALTKLLDAEPDIEVVGSTGNGERAIELTAALDVDVVVLDRRLEDNVDGFDLLARLGIVAPRAAVLIVSGANDDRSTARAMAAGSHGFVSKGRPSAEIIGAVRTVAAGGTVFPPGVPEHASGAEALLSPREVQILELLAAGRSTSEMATELYVSVNTIRNHVNAVIKKLGAHSRLEAVAEGVRLGLVEMA